ncbi:hypothetical protein P9112_010831 [Eukaryota sp. TZLM1-RC]
MRLAVFVLLFVVNSYAQVLFEPTLVIVNQTTTLTITVSDAHALDTLVSVYCQLNLILYPATIISMNTAFCELPPQPQPGTFTPSLVLEYSSNESLTLSSSTHLTYFSIKQPQPSFLPRTFNNNIYIPLVIPHDPEFTMEEVSCRSNARVTKGYVENSVMVCPLKLEESDSLFFDFESDSFAVDLDFALESSYYFPTVPIILPIYDLYDVIPRSISQLGGTIEIFGSAVFHLLRKGAIKAIIQKDDVMVNLSQLKGQNSLQFHVPPMIFSGKADLIIEFCSVCDFSFVKASVISLFVKQIESQTISIRIPRNSTAQIELYFADGVEFLIYSESIIGRINSDHLLEPFFNYHSANHFYNETLEVGVLYNTSELVVHKVEILVINQPPINKIKVIRDFAPSETPSFLIDDLIVDPDDDDFDLIDVYFDPRLLSIDYDPYSRQIWVGFTSEILCHKDENLNFEIFVTDYVTNTSLFFAIEPKNEVSDVVVTPTFTMINQSFVIGVESSCLSPFVSAFCIFSANINTENFASSVIFHDDLYYCPFPQYGNIWNLSIKFDNASSSPFTFITPTASQDAQGMLTLSNISEVDYKIFCVNNTVQSDPILIHQSTNDSVVVQCSNSSSPSPDHPPALCFTAKDPHKVVIPCVNVTKFKEKEELPVKFKVFRNKCNQLPLHCNHSTNVLARPIYGNLMHDRSLCHYPLFELLPHNDCFLYYEPGREFWEWNATLSSSIDIRNVSANGTVIHNEISIYLEVFNRPPTPFFGEVNVTATNVTLISLPISDPDGDSVRLLSMQSSDAMSMKVVPCKEPLIVYHPGNSCGFHASSLTYTVIDTYGSTSQGEVFINVDVPIEIESHQEYVFNSTLSIYGNGFSKFNDLKCFVDGVPAAVSIISCNHLTCHLKDELTFGTRIATISIDSKFSKLVSFKYFKPEGQLDGLYIRIPLEQDFLKEIDWICLFNGNFQTIASIESSNIRCPLHDAPLTNTSTLSLVSQDSNVSLPVPVPDEFSFISSSRLLLHEDNVGIALDSDSQLSVPFNDSVPFALGFWVRSDSNDLNQIIVSTFYSSCDVSSAGFTLSLNAQGLRTRTLTLTVISNTQECLRIETKTRIPLIQWTYVSISFTASHKDELVKLKVNGYLEGSLLLNRKHGNLKRLSLGSYLLGGVDRNQLGRTGNNFRGIMANLQIHDNPSSLHNDLEMAAASSNGVGILPRCDECLVRTMIPQRELTFLFMNMSPIELNLIDLTGDVPEGLYLVFTQLPRVEMASLLIYTPNKTVETVQPGKLFPIFPSMELFFKPNTFHNLSVISFKLTDGASLESHSQTALVYGRLGFIESLSTDTRRLFFKVEEYNVVTVLTDDDLSVGFPSVYLQKYSSSSLTLFQTLDGNRPSRIVTSLPTRVSDGRGRFFVKATEAGNFTITVEVRYRSGGSVSRVFNIDAYQHDILDVRVGFQYSLIVLIVLIIAGLWFSRKFIRGKIGNRAVESPFPRAAITP